MQEPFFLIWDQDTNVKLGAHVKCSKFCKFSDGSGFEHIIFSFWLSDCDENLRLDFNFSLTNDILECCIKINDICGGLIYNLQITKYPDC